MCVCLCLSAAHSFAQVGMTGALPDKSAALDINATNKGLLINRVSLLSTTDSASIQGGHPAQSLLVYNTNAALPRGTGFYYWDGAVWRKMLTSLDSADNLGNHRATQGLNMNGNSISNDGTNTKGLKFDATGNGTFQQQLSVVNLPAGATTDSLLAVDATGLLKKSASLSSTSLRSSYSTTAIAPGASGSVTTTARTTDFMVTVSITNSCGTNAVAVFMVAGSVITFLSGQAGTTPYTWSIADANGATGNVAASTTTCAGDNGDAAQFNFNIAISGKTLTIINNSATATRTYNISVVEN